MISTSAKGLSILLVLLSIAVPTLQRDWQGTGNMSSSNMTEINTNINSYPITSSTTSAQINVIAKNISTRLNSIWAPAWNVMIVKSSEPFDTVVYSYAFNNHWLWINGIPIPSTSNILSYIIWKDYNCHNWKTLSEIQAAGGTTFDGDQLGSIGLYSFSGVATDIWKNAFEYSKNLLSQSALSNGAFAIVMSQDR